MILADDVAEFMRWPRAFKLSWMTSTRKDVCEASGVMLKAASGRRLAG